MTNKEEKFLSRKRVFKEKDLIEKGKSCPEPKGKSSKCSGRAEGENIEKGLVE